MDKHLIQAVFIQGILKHILVGPKFHGLFHIFKIIMTAKYDNIYGMIGLPYPSDQFDSIHQRHRDIRDHHLRP